MLIKQDFYFNSLGVNRPLHIRITDHGEPPVTFLTASYQKIGA